MSAAAYAARYCSRLGLALVPLDGKRPIGAAWNVDANLIRSPAAARKYWTRYPQRNLGACLEPSGLVSLDCDDLSGARTVLAPEGLDLDELIRGTPTIVGRAPRLEFKAPDAPLGRKSVVWPPRAAGEKPITVLEFRAGRLQDVLPPSLHPDTRLAYHWATPPRDGFPPLPDKLLQLWQDFDAFKHRARNLCPWADPEPEPDQKAPRSVRGPFTRPSVIAAFNEAHDIAAILAARGYIPAGRKRWKSPSGHGVAGVVLLPSGKVYCHHTSDPLGDERAHDAFDLFALFEHGGDVRAAIRAAAEALGMASGRRRA